MLTKLQTKNKRQTHDNYHVDEKRKLEKEYKSRQEMNEPHS